LATKIAKRSNEPVPDAVNTSNESSSSSTDPDTSSGFDLNDLAGELRGLRDNESQEKADYIERNQPQFRRRNSATSFDTLGAPKPASLAQTSVPPSNLQKPVALNPAKVSPKLPPPSNKKSNLSNMPPYILPQPSPDNRTRAVTPIVRMRNQSSEQKGITAGDVQQTLTEDEIRAIKQKKWKEKMKIAKKNRDKEKSKLHALKNKKNRSEKSQQRKKTNSKMRKIPKQPSFFSVGGLKYQIPSGIPTCKGDFIELLEKFMSTRCGNIDDTFDGDEDGDDESFESNDLSFYSDDDESDSDSEASSVAKKEKRVVKSVKQNRQLKLFNDEQPKNTITVDISEKQFIRQFIALATTEGFLLISHKRNHTNALRRPSKNIALLRRGIQTRSGHYSGPKLVWNEVKGDEKGEIDLFAIRSIENATTLELEDYPYAMPGRSLFLRLNKGDDYVFEARDATEALRFVHGMRWLIARLAFNLIIGNVSVACELLDVWDATNIEDRYGMFPSSVREETRWTMAMNEATTHLVQEVSTSIH
jgi:hypothetical protein